MSEKPEVQNSDILQIQYPDDEQPIWILRTSMTPLTGTITEKAQSRISVDIDSPVYLQLEHGLEFEFTDVRKHIKTGKIRIKVYNEDGFKGWITYKTDDGTQLVELLPGNSSEIFNFPEGNISLYDD